VSLAEKNKQIEWMGWVKVPFQVRKISSDYNNNILDKASVRNFSWRYEKITLASS